MLARQSAQTGTRAQTGPLRPHATRHRPTEASHTPTARHSDPPPWLPGLRGECKAGLLAPKFGSAPWRRQAGAPYHLQSSRKRRGMDAKATECTVDQLGQFKFHIRCSIVVSISACPAEDLGSITGGGVYFSGRPFSTRRVDGSPTNSQHPDVSMGLPARWL